jgi:ribose transport system ATP-binding protein
MMKKDDSSELLSMKHITKTFPGVIALDDVHFELRQGEVHTLVGENGAGKSTLIKILSGAYRADKGEIYLDKKKIHIQTPHHAQVLGISTIYQEVTIVPDMSIAENMFLGKEIKKKGLISHRNQIRETERLLERFDYSLDPRRHIKDLLVAEKHMISIIKAISDNPKILILDEPTASLTDREKDILFQNIRRLQEKGSGIIYISHRLEELKEIGDSVTVLRNGKYVDTLPLGDVQSIDDLLPLMLGKEVRDKYPKVPAEVGKPHLRVREFTRKGSFYDVNFDCKEGEILGIFGLVGCGFEEVLRSIFGADPYDSGYVEVASNGGFVRLSKNKPKAALDSMVTYLPSDRKYEGLVMPMTVKENIVISSYRKLSSKVLGFIKSREVDALAVKFKERLDIKAPSVKTIVETLSGGNQQKVILAKSLCRGGNVFLFSEPTSGIDVGTKVEIYQFMNQLTAQGAGVILVSYELPEIMGMSDRILVMYQGRIMKEFERKDATEDDILRFAFGHGAEKSSNT